MGKRFWGFIILTAAIHSVVRAREPSRKPNQTSNASFVKGASVVRALAMVWSDSLSSESKGMIVYNGSAFRLAKDGRGFWISAAHVVDELKSKPQFYLSPSRFQPNATFAQPIVDYEDHRRSVSNLVRAKPKLYLTANPRQILSDAETSISLPYISAGQVLNGKGNDLCMINGSSNFDDSQDASISLRDLKLFPLKPGEQLNIFGYPQTALGRPVFSLCEFRGFTFLAGGFRGLLFCRFSGDTGGFSGGPILDKESRVVGVLSSQLPTTSRIESEYHDAIMLFTPIVWRGARVDGFSQGEIESEKCVRPESAEGHVVLRPMTTCAD